MVFIFIYAFPISIILYVALPIWMLCRGSLVGAGLSMMAAALLPLIAFKITTGDPISYAIGFVGLTIIMIAIACIPIAIAGILALKRSLGTPRA